MLKIKKDDILSFVKRNYYVLHIKGGIKLAKKSKLARAQRQRAMVAQYASLRQKLKESGDYQALAKLPKDSHPNRLRERDRIDGRPRGYMSKFGLSRINFRELVHQGYLPGVRKASW